MIIKDERKQLNNQNTYKQNKRLIVKETYRKKIS